MDINENNLTCLASRDAYHSGVDYSPDGQHIAYKSNWDGHWNLYVMGADGGNIVQITHEQGEALNTRGVGNIEGTPGQFRCEIEGMYLSLGPFWNCPYKT